MQKNPHKKSRFYSKIANRLRKKYRQFSKKALKYQYKGFFIYLPPYHLLPEYQEEHPKYDRFLPHIVKYINESETVIDIGANVGDTLAGMVEQNSTASYICIEPDDSFYKYLEQNIELIKKSFHDLRILSIKALVGNNVQNISLIGAGGTKHAILDGTGSLNSIPLDKLIPNDEITNIKLLKSDVDVFDYDVINSSMPVIEKYKPIIFFECYYDYEYQKSGYCDMVRSLESCGYCDWTVFDNFGEVIVRTQDIETIFQLIHYIWKQKIGLSTPTIYYYDILAVQNRDSALIDKVLEEYS